MSISGVVRLSARPASSRLRRDAISLTSSAAGRLKDLMRQRDPPAAGIRLGVRERGCSGRSYYLDYADQQGKHDEVVETEGIKMFIDPQALLYVIGTEMDFTEDEKNGSAEFVFTNPNAKSVCGCNESFSV